MLDIIILDAFDECIFELSINRIINENKNIIMIIKNGANIEVSLKINPYSIKNVKFIFSITGSLIIYKLKTNEK